MTICVTSPTGNIGRRVAELLVADGERVRVVVRDPGRLSPTIRERAEVVRGSHGDAGVVDRAFRDCEAVFWLCPPDRSKTLDEAYVDFTRPAAEAIRRHGVGHVVSVTGLGRDTRWEATAGLVTASIHMVDLLMSAGAAHRGLAMPSFMENHLAALGAIVDGVMSGPIDPDLKAPITATRDMGTEAARLLADRSWSGQREVPVLGPQDLTHAEIAETTSQVLGRPVTYEQVSFAEFAAGLAASGMTPSFVEGYVAMLTAKNEGMDEVADRSDAVIGTTTYRAWAQDVLRPAVTRASSSPQ